MEEKEISSPAPIHWTDRSGDFALNSHAFLCDDSLLLPLFDFCCGQPEF